MPSKVHFILNINSDKNNKNRQNGTTTNRWLPHLPLYVKLVSYYALAVSTVQPDGIPLAPVTFHVAAEFFTNVPLPETPSTQ